MSYYNDQNETIYIYFDEFDFEANYSLIINYTEENQFYVGISSEGYFSLIAKTTEYNQSFSIFINNNINSLQSFNVTITESYVGDDAHDYNKLKDIFPEIENEQTGHWFALVVIIALLVVGVLFICVPLKFNKISLILTFLLGLFATFVMAWAGYGEWSWFIVPPALIVIYFVVKLMAGGD